jgi:hypothetical protein
VKFRISPGRPWKLQVVRFALHGIGDDVEVGMEVAVLVDLVVVVWARGARATMGMMAWRWRILSSTLDFSQRSFLHFDLGFEMALESH